MGLSTRITLLTFAAVTTAAVLVSAIAIVGVDRVVLGEETARLESFRTLVVGSVDARLGTTERSIDLLASRVTPSDLTTLAATARLESLLSARADTFDALALIDPDGASFGAGAPGVVEAARTVIVRSPASAAPDLVWAGGADPGARLWATRTTGDGTGTVTLAGRVRTDYLGRYLDDVEKSTGSLAAFVADGSGVHVLSGAGGPEVSADTVTYAQEPMGGHRGTAVAHSSALGGMRGFWESIVPDHGLGWRVVVLEAEADAFARARQALLPALLAMLAVVAGAVLTALWYSRRVLSPLTVFEQRARDVAAGGYVRPMKIARDDEMGRVTEAFNDMGVRLNSLQDMTQLLASASSLDDELDAVLSALGRILGTGDSAILLSDRSGLALSLARGRGLAAPSETLLVGLDGPSPLATAFTSRVPVPFSGDEPDGAAAIYRLFGADPLRAGVAVPLVAGSDVIGVVVVLAPGHRVFTTAQVDTLQVFTANAAIAVRTSRLFAEERLSRREAEALRTVAEITVRPGDLGRALEGSGAIAARLLGFGSWGVALEGRQQLGLGLPADAEADTRLLDAWRAIEATRPGSGTAADTPLVVSDMRQRPDLTALTGPGWGSALFIPVLQGSIARGAIVLHDRAHLQPDPRQLAIAATIGQQVSLAIRNAHLLQQARSRATNLETVFRISQAVSSELDVGSVLDSVLDVVQKILYADAVSLMSYEAARGSIETSITRGLAADLLQFATRPGEDIPGRVFSLGVPLSYGDLSQHSTRLASIAFGHGFESLVAVPLMARGRPMGVLTVYAKTAAAFTAEDVELLLTFASQAALAIDTAALYGKEHHVASVLQASILPDTLPSIEGLEAASFYLPFGPEAEIGGDFFDLFETEQDGVVLAIGDVCGKGVAAATKTSMVKYTLRGLIGAGLSPGQAMGELNRQVARTGDPSDIVTMWVGTLDRTSGVLTYADAGHPPALLLRHDTRVAERMGATGPLLGAVPRTVYEDHEVDFRVGDTLLLYTDGVTETRRGVRLFGEGRVRRVLRHSDTARACVDSLLDAVKMFADGPLKDDAAALAVRRFVDASHGEGENDTHDG